MISYFAKHKEFCAVLQQAYMIHSRPYKDNGLLVELFCETQGRLTVFARGIRKPKSKLYGSLSLFTPLLVSYSGKTDLKTLTQIEITSKNYDISGDNLLIGLYLNELLIKLLPKNDPYPDLYNAYDNILGILATTNNPEIELRIFEKLLLAQIGYGLQLTQTCDGEQIYPDYKYTFKFGYGFKKSVNINEQHFDGSSLLALSKNMFNTSNQLRDAKRLLRNVFAILLENKPLKSRELFENFKKIICATFCDHIV